MPREVRLEGALELEVAHRGPVRGHAGQRLGVPLHLGHQRLRVGAGRRERRVREDRGEHLALGMRGEILRARDLDPVDGRERLRGDERGGPRVAVGVGRVALLQVRLEPRFLRRPLAGLEQRRRRPEVRHLAVPDDVDGGRRARALVVRRQQAPRVHDGVEQRALAVALLADDADLEAGQPRRRVDLLLPPPPVRPERLDLRPVAERREAAVERLAERRREAARGDGERLRVRRRLAAHAVVLLELLEPPPDAAQLAARRLRHRREPRGERVRGRGPGDDRGRAAARGGHRGAVENHPLGLLAEATQRLVGELVVAPELLLALVDGRRLVERERRQLPEPGQQKGDST
mmetsp:Transcript_23923/g.82152  ORF Transcript_23923/g.82152 Transcript_23923/m.82152 type:complete len:348 (-) Transcript_23923:5-1048(-)